MMAWGGFLVVVPVVVTREVGSSANADPIVGRICAAAGLSGALGVLLAGRLQGREQPTIGFGIAATVVVIYPFSTVLGLYGLITGIVIIGFLSGRSMSDYLPCASAEQNRNGWLGF
jgi:hypothetical protein